ncbi:MAG TPA: hypothetical protein VF192_09885 [Longimicrobiales bacterium]
MLGRRSVLGMRVRGSRPRLVFRHPVRRIHIVRRRHARHRHAPEGAFGAPPWVVGLGAAVLALPVGIWLGRKMGD